MTPAETPRADGGEQCVTPGGGGRRLRWYPYSWRARYGDELLAVLDDEYGGHLPLRVHLSLARGGLRQRARQSGLTGDSASPAERIRAGALVVLSAWTAFVIAGASFAKFSEHFDQALPHRASAHRVADLAFTVLQSVAGVAGALVMVGTALAVPGFVRFLRTGGWASLRKHFVRAVSCTALVIATTMALRSWAHHLSAHQRNGGLDWYTVAFLAWAGLIIVALTLWTAAAVAAGRRMEFSNALLAAEVTLATTITVAMVAMVGATAVWWGAMAKDAPTYLNAGPGGAAGSAWNVWLLGTMLLMLAATGSAVTSVARALHVRTQI